MEARATETTDTTAAADSGRSRGLVVTTVLGLLKLVLTVALLFGAAGRLDWIEGWVCLVVMIGSAAAVIAILKRRNPGLMARRTRMGEGTKGWDKILVRPIVALPALIMVVAALDAVRFGWSSMPAWLCPAGVALYLAGFLVVSRAMLENNHFEATVRIQSDVGHKVCDSGPYRFVRHPGYVGMFLVVLGLPLMLRSWWAFLPAALNVALLVIRTALEDRTLRRELEGYAEFAARVRYRLLPGVW